jgi:hypothetical protein
MEARARAPAGSRGGPLPPGGVRQKPALPASQRQRQWSHWHLALAVTVTRTRFAGCQWRASQCRCVALLAAPVAPGGCGGPRAADGLSLSEGRPPAHCQWHSGDDAAA